MQSKLQKYSELARYLVVGVGGKHRNHKKAQMQQASISTLLQKSDMLGQTKCNTPVYSAKHLSKYNHLCLCKDIVSSCQKTWTTSL